MKTIEMANERSYIRSQSYNAAGNRTAANDAVHIPGSGQMNFTDFLWLRPQTLLLPGGGEIALSYDDFLQVKERILEDPANNNVAEAIYQYDLEGNIERTTTNEGAYSFGYDSTYRLTSAQYPELLVANDEEFGYDGVGNRTHHSVTLNSGTEEPEKQEQASVYNDQNQLIQKGDATFTYNANGHTATKTENGRFTEYLYNHEERLIAVRIDGNTVGRYAYNPEGHRIKKTVNGVTTYFLYNEEGLAAEYDAYGNLIKEYHFKPYETWMTEPLFQRTADGQVYYYQNDHLGTPQRMVRSNGAVVWQAYYSAFGEADIVIEEVQNNLRFPGQYYDQETGLHHNFHRDYEPELGRYLQSDPIKLRGGLNTYIYSTSRPTIMVDPTGEKGFFGAACFAAAFGWSGGTIVHHASVASEEIESIDFHLDTINEMIDECGPGDNDRRDELLSIQRDLIIRRHEVLQELADNVPNVAEELVTTIICGVIFLVAP